MRGTRSKQTVPQSPHLSDRPSCDRTHHDPATTLQRCASCAESAATWRRYNRLRARDITLKWVKWRKEIVPVCDGPLAIRDLEDQNRTSRIWSTDARSPPRGVGHDTRGNTALGLLSRALVPIEIAANVGMRITDFGESRLALALRRRRRHRSRSSTSFLEDAG
jgi:hypothetical protein